MLGQDGWEPTSTAFLEDGKFRAASEKHFTVGSYEVSGSRFEISASGVAHGDARTVFGKKQKEMNLKFEGEIEGDQIDGQASDGSSYKVSFRLVSLADLP